VPAYAGEHFQRLLGNAATPGFDPAYAVDFWDLVNRQDWEICASVQKGMSSRAFSFGYYAPMEDLSLDIRRYLADTLGRSSLISRPADTGSIAGWNTAG